MPCTAYYGTKERVNYHRCVIYVVRIAPNQSWRDSAPCQDCEASLSSFGFRKIIFSTNEGLVHHVLRPGKMSSLHVTTSRRKEQMQRP